MKTNYEILLEKEKTLNTIKFNFPDEESLLLEKLEIEHDFNVLNVKNGKLGIAKSYDEKTVSFSVPSEGFSEYKISIQELNENFLELPRKLVEEKGFESTPVFIINKENNAVGVVFESAEKLAVKWEGSQLKMIPENGVEWISELVGIEK